MMRLCRAQADGHMVSTRLTFRNSTVAGVSAATLTFSTEPGAQA